MGNRETGLAYTTALKDELPMIGATLPNISNYSQTKFVQYLGGFHIQQVKMSPLWAVM